jgi:hypothetical protein
MAQEGSQLEQAGTRIGARSVPAKERPHGEGMSQVMEPR